MELLTRRVYRTLIQRKKKVMMQEKSILDQAPRCCRYDGTASSITVTTAYVIDRDGTIQMILLNLDNLSHVEKFLVDGGYSGERFAKQVTDICGAQVEVVKRSELHKFVVLPRRWVVERLFGWLDKFRRLWKNCERKFLTSAQILTFALIVILINRRPSSLSRVSDGAMDWERHIEYLKSSVRCKVEYPFRIIKCLFGYRKTVYRGLKKNENRLYAMLAS